MKSCVFCCLWLWGFVPGGTATTVAQTSAGQSAVAQASASPTLDETVAFLRQIYQRQQPQAVSYGSPQGFLYQTVSSIEQPSPCLLEFVTLNHDGNPETNWVQRSVLDLTQSDPLSVSLELSQKGSPGEVRVTVKNAIELSYWAPPDPDTGVPIQPYLPGIGGDDGFVLSTSADGIVVVNVSRRRYLIAAPVLQQSRVTRDGQMATTAAIQAGDSFSYEKRDRKAGPDFAFTSAPSKALPERFSRFESPLLSNDETASRVAKAFIHAMTLCHEDKKPLPF